MGEKNASLKDLLQTIERTLNLAWGTNWGDFTKAYPTKSDPNTLNLPIITHRVKEKVPSTMGSHKELKPRVRSQFKTDKDHITIWGQRFDCVLEFGMWGRGDSQVADLAERFEEFMLTYSGIFKEMGIVEIVYIKTTDEQPPNSWRVNLDSRHMYFHVVVEKLTPVSNNTLQSIRLKILNEDGELIETVDPLN